MRAPVFRCGVARGHRRSSFGSWSAWRRRLRRTISKRRSCIPGRRIQGETMPSDYFRRKYDVIITFMPNTTKRFQVTGRTEKGSRRLWVTASPRNDALGNDFEKTRKKKRANPLGGRVGSRVSPKVASNRVIEATRLLGAKRKRGPCQAYMPTYCSSCRGYGRKLRSCSNYRSCRRP